MSFTVYASPNYNTRKRKTRINLRDYTGGTGFGNSIDVSNTIFSSYRGRTDRIERYRIYDWLDSDSDIYRALDIISEHCTNKNEHSKFPFDFHFNIDDPSREETKVLENAMQQWLKINSFDKRLFRNIRNVIKYGDWFYFRNEATYELFNLHPKNVLGAIINNENLEVMGWVVRDFKFNVEDLEIAQMSHTIQDHLKALSQGGGYQNCRVIPAKHIIHLTLNEGKFSGSASDEDMTDIFSSRWPFGESILESIYKVFKQRELLEDAILIHRVQRAPTRRVWYIDVGKTRADRAEYTIRKFQNDLNQKRIPQMVGNNIQTVDSTYNPQSQLEDYYIPVSADQRGSKVETLEGIPWNDLPDLKYFTMKMLRAMRVPYAFLVGPEEGGAMFNDSKVGTAYMQEIEFSQFCHRIQIDVVENYDHEFKMYLKARGININPADFRIEFVPPTNWETDRQRARDTDNIAVWSQVKDIPWISQRFAAKKYGGWSDNDLTENEQMKLEEDNMLNDTGTSSMGMGSMGGGMGMGMGSMGGGMPMGGEMGSMDGQMGNEMPQSQTGMNGSMGTGGGMSSGMNPGGGMAMGESKINSNNLLLEEITSADLEPVEAKLKTTGIYKSRTEKDDLFGKENPVQYTPKVTLKMLRDLRIAQMQKRIEAQKRLKIISKVYKKASDGNGMM